MIIALCFTLVLFNECNGKYTKPQVNPDKFVLFFKILLQNTGFAISLLLGCFFLNITTICLLIYTSISWGKSFNNLYCLAGWEKAVTFVLPHIVFEITWIIFACQLSVKMSFQILDLFNERIDAEKFLSDIKGPHFSSFLRIFALVLLAAIVECFITPIFI